MKCTIPEISWHNREPVLSVHIHPVNEKFYRLATGGADCHVLIWQLNICDNGAVKIEALSDLTRHQRAINSVRWSPSGQYLATADDDANIIVWQLKTDNVPLLEGDTNDKEVWIVYKIMRGHKEDIYDLVWSPNGSKLLSGSIDNTAILWDFNKGKMEQILSDHKGFVQGVTWDPKAHYVATISTDRVCRIYDSHTKQVRARIHKGLLPVPRAHFLYDKEAKYFHDDTFKSFFRRLDFSPEGTLLAVPSGRVEIDDCKRALNGTYIFAVDNWTSPVAILPSGKQCSTVVRFCPTLYELRPDGPRPPSIPLPYRMCVAVGTDRDVIIYDTQQMAPFAYFRDIHYTRLTDLSWSRDGRVLIASSTDGFCSMITFDPEELGVQYVETSEAAAAAEESVLDISGCEELSSLVTKEDGNNKCDSSKDTGQKSAAEKDEAGNSTTNTVPVVPKAPKKPSFLDQWTIKTPKRKGVLPSTEASTTKSTEDTSTSNGDSGGTISAKPSFSGSTTQLNSTAVIDLTEESNECCKAAEESASKDKNSDLNENKRKVSEEEEDDETRQTSSGNNDDKSLPKRIKPIPVQLPDSLNGSSKNLVPSTSNSRSQSTNDKSVVSMATTSTTTTTTNQVAVKNSTNEKTLVSIATTSTTTTTNQVAVKNSHSDAKPIAVRRKPREPAQSSTENSAKKPKAATMLNFLKKPSQTKDSKKIGANTPKKSRENDTTPKLNHKEGNSSCTNPDIVLEDSGVARDSWTINCDSNEPKKLEFEPSEMSKNDVQGGSKDDCAMLVDDGNDSQITEDFSLHLEDTPADLNTSAQIEDSSGDNTIRQEDTGQVTGENSDADKNNVTEGQENAMTTVGAPEAETRSSPESNVTKLSDTSGVNNKNEIDSAEHNKVTKRRIPLITLSSPKQKNKK